MTKKRESWDKYFIRLAIQTSTRATCPRLHAGSVIVKDNMILSGGYNGSIRGSPHCTDEDVGCLMIDSHCRRTIHSEANAIIQAARVGAKIKGSVMYVTHLPCWECFKLIANAGINKIYYNKYYDNKSNEYMLMTAKKIGIEIERVILGDNDKESYLDELDDEHLLTSINKIPVDGNDNDPWWEEDKWNKLTTSDDKQ